MTNLNGTGFPSMSDLVFLKSMNALQPSQVKIYFDGNAINTQQAIQLGYTPTNTMNQAKPTPKATSNVGQKPNVNPNATLNTNPNK